MKKHAYLIIAHNQWILLKKLIHMLDDVRNDIYIHINVNVSGVPFDEIINTSKQSKVTFVDRIPIKRGTYSIFNAEMILLKAALIGGDYSYFHLLSGQDLPLKNQDCIHSFFDENNGFNFVDVQPIERIKKSWIERYSLYNLMVPYILDNTYKALFARFLDKTSKILQKILRVNRMKLFKQYELNIGYGSNFFSITNEFASFIISKESVINKLYKKWTFAPDESVLQTFLYSSKFKETMYKANWIDYNSNRANLRLIFWSGRSHPDTITMNHFEALRTTKNLFARKFDINKYPDVVNAVEHMVLNDGGTNK